MKTKTTKQKKQQRIVFAILGIILLIALILHFRKTTRSDEIEKEITANSAGTPSNSNVSYSGLVQKGNNYLLKRGEVCAEVRWSQYYYNKIIAIPNGKTALKEDGIFGPKTETVVKSILGKTTTTWAEWKTKLDSISSNSISSAAAGAITGII